MATGGEPMTQRADRMRCPLCDAHGDFVFVASDEFIEANPGGTVIFKGSCGLCEGKGYLCTSGQDLADPGAVRGLPIPRSVITPWQTGPGSAGRAGDVFKAIAAELERAFGYARGGKCPRCGAIMIEKPRRFLGGIPVTANICSNPKCDWVHFTRRKGP